MRFKDKVILVTGSTRGIGLATALRFAQEGGILIVHGPEENTEMDKAYAQVQALSPQSIKMPCELSDSQSIREAFKGIDSHFNRLDVLVNNAAQQSEFPFLKIPEEEWDRILAVDLKAPFLWGQMAANRMVEQGGGKIINIGSVHEFQTKRNYASYSAAKGGLLMLTKSMALELAPYNMQVNHVTPGAVATGLTDEARRRRLLSAVPSGRVGQPSDIAAMVCYVASEEANYITGTSFVVDGGLTLGICASRPDL